MRFTQLMGFIFATLPALGGLSSAFALDWKKTTLAATTAPFQAEQQAVFEFTNHSAKAVAIRDIETSCSCLVAKSDQAIYPPGASGKITANFTVGDRGGLYERTVTVRTDESDEPVHLVFKIEVPEVAVATPRSVAWRLNEVPTEKNVDLTAAAGLEINFLNAQCTSDAYTVSLEAIEAGRLYRLHIKPNTTKSPASAAIRVIGREKSGHDVLLSAYASVQ